MEIKSEKIINKKMLISVNSDKEIKGSVLVIPKIWSRISSIRINGKSTKKYEINNKKSQIYVGFDALQGETEIKVTYV